MKKITKIKRQNAFIQLFVLLVLLNSCGKITDEYQSVVQSTTKNMVIDSNTITLSKATNVAQKFLQAKNANITISIENAQTIVKNGIPYFHIINANKGFVIISPDSLYNPILAYDSIGNFSFADENLNPGLLRWLNKQAFELDFIRNHKNFRTDSIGEKNKILWRILGGSITKEEGKEPNLDISNKQANRIVPFVYPPVLISSEEIAFDTHMIVGPLCLTSWDQIYPFNEFCPDVNNPTFKYNGLAPAGCLPIAMAQIMYFWNYPNTYNWSSMYLSKAIIDATPGSRAGTDEMARLIHDIGSTTGPYFMNTFADYKYVDGGTSSDDSYAPWVFGAFGYTSASRTETISDQVLSGAKNGTPYSGLLTDEIQINERPCILSGFSDQSTVLGLVYWPSGSGHSWVCDGSNISKYYSGVKNTYRSYWGEITTQTLYSLSFTISYLHMNWGWGGTGQTNSYLTNDGWYDCQTNYSQADGTSENFRYFQTVIYNIHP